MSLKSNLRKLINVGGSRAAAPDAPRMVRYTTTGKNFLFTPPSDGLVTFFVQGEPLPGFVPGIEIGYDGYTELRFLTRAVDGSTWAPVAKGQRVRLTTFNNVAFDKLEQIYYTFVPTLGGGGITKSRRVALIAEVCHA